MKKVMAMFLAIVLATVSAVQGQQYQLLNPGFEQWDGGNTSEPTHWNTFSSSDGSFASLASSNHHYRRNGHRPGGTGSYYLTIYTQSIFGIKANGNMTTGRVHAGAMSAASSDNYNYTQRSNADHSQPFTATPDSMYVWVSFYAANAASVAQVSVIIHGDSDFKSPNDENSSSLYKAKAVAYTTRTTSSASQMNWQQVKVPFYYNGNSAARYILVNISTNNIPGSGEANDSLSVDDIEFIYSAWLNGINVDGAPIAGFAKNTFNYAVSVADTAALMTAAVAVQTEVSDATVQETRTRTSDSTATVTLTVTAEDGVTVKTYTVALSAPMPQPVYYTVSATSADAMMGSANVSPSGSVLENTSVTATATATGGYHFVLWNNASGAMVSTDNPYTFTLTANTDLVAVFAADSVEPETYTVTVVYDQTMGTVTGEGTYDAGDTAILVATPIEGYRFVNWSDNVTDSLRTVVVNSDITLEATFAPVSHEGIGGVYGTTMALYPNPATGSVNIALGERAEVSIVDQSGRIVSRMAVEGSATIDLDGMVKGAYYVHAVSASGVAVRKLIVK